MYAPTFEFLRGGGLKLDNVCNCLPLIDFVVINYMIYSTEDNKRESYPNKQKICIYIYIYIYLFIYIYIYIYIYLYIYTESRKSHGSTAVSRRKVY